MYTVDEIATIVGGRLLHADEATPRRIVHDSRDVLEGDLFVALRGRRVDGHAFLSDAFARGACGALISDPESPPVDARNLIVVDDPLTSLQRLAAAWRNALDTTFVGITGSNGKTTTRALLAHLLREPDGARAVFNAPKNYNTEVGLPLALLAMPEAASIGLFELGTERPGDIAALAGILVPEIGLITSIGPSHLDGFGAVEAVAREKWSLIESLPAHGYAVLNADSPHLRRLAEKAPGRCLTVGLTQGEVRGRLEREVPQIDLVVDDPPMRFDCPLIGRHNAVNLLLAAVTAERLGLPVSKIEERARTFAPVPHRLQLVPAPFGSILDDTYNANPASAAGALYAFARFGGDEMHRVFVFGEMHDLGPDTERYHRDVLDLAVRLGVDAILPVGTGAVSVCQDRSARAIKIVDRDQLGHTIQTLCQDSTESLVLVKGSRALELERLVGELTNGGK
jgi:UDP-N-acetylmuramoyl-tripeptide--D-alanyl-D-alanine ligase